MFTNSSIDIHQGVNWLHTTVQTAPIDLRQVYDTYGDEERMPQQQRHHYQQDFMTPEDQRAGKLQGGVPQ